MALRHALVRIVLAVAWILGDVVGAHDALAREGRREDRGVARHREFREGLARHAGQRVEQIAFAGLVGDVVEERPERGAGQLGGGIGDDLDGAVDIELRGDVCATAQQPAQRAGFGAVFVYYATIGHSTPGNALPANVGTRL